MNMSQSKHRKGLTIVEVMVAITVLAVAALGASAYRYYSTLDVRRADMRTTAARLGLLLCESWRGAGGDTSYDPTAHLGSYRRRASSSTRALVRWAAICSKQMISTITRFFRGKMSVRACGP
jgi:prepilin-type N-terminal cleavage/methylation domain-containing protein